MKNKLITLFLIFAVVAAGAATVTKFTGNTNKEKDKEGFTVVTSFYPMYILTSNLTKDIPGVSVVNLTENQTGCLHDYQLTTQDMIELDSADLLVMNGGGMESFIEGVLTSYPELEVVEAGKGIQMLDNQSEHNHEHIAEADEDEDHDHEDHEEYEDHDHEDHEDHDHEDHNHEDHEHEEENHDHHHDHGEYNAHVWMDMSNYLIQMQNVYEALSQMDPDHAREYEKNYKAYQEKVEEVKKEYEQELTDVKNRDVVIFHDAFAYLAKELGLDVVYTINLDSDTYLSAGEVKEIIDEVNRHQVKVLFTEEQYSDSIAESVAKETDASVYVIDSLVTGADDLDSYLKGMKYNLSVLKKALY